MAGRVTSVGLVRALACLALGVHATADSVSGSARAEASAADAATTGLEVLEERLRADPYDREARAGLIDHYSRGRWREDPGARRHAELVLWLVENAPRDRLFETPKGQIDPGVDAERYVRAKHLWLDHLDRAPGDLDLLRNAASFFEHNDRGLAVSLLESAQEMDPSNASWPFELGSVRWGTARFGATAADRAELVVAASLFERAYALAEENADEWLPVYAVYTIRGMFDAGRLADARTYADEALNRTGSEWWDGDVRHHANLVLGRIALAEDDVARAKVHLLAAGRVAGTATLGSFGPNMKLAHDLLERGEREVVLEYFELCSRFWDPERLADWADLVEKGRIPDFGHSLFV